MRLKEQNSHSHLKSWNRLLPLLLWSLLSPNENNCAAKSKFLREDKKHSQRQIWWRNMISGFGALFKLFFFSMELQLSFALCHCWSLALIAANVHCWNRCAQQIVGISICLNRHLQIDEIVQKMIFLSIHCSNIAKQPLTSAGPRKFIVCWCWFNMFCNAYLTFLQNNHNHIWSVLGNVGRV